MSKIFAAAALTIAMSATAIAEAQTGATSEDERGVRGLPGNKSGVSPNR